MSLIIRKGEGSTARVNVPVPKSAKFYLSGGMEYAADYGKGWRDITEEALIPKGLTFYNPCKEEKPVLHHHGLSDPSEVFDLKRWETLDKATQVVHHFLQKDFEAVKECYGLIVHYDQATQRGAGTAMEVGWAYYTNLQELRNHKGEEARYGAIQLSDKKALDVKEWQMYDHPWYTPGVPVFLVVDSQLKVQDVSLSMLSMATHIFETLEDCIVYIERCMGYHSELVEDFLKDAGQKQNKFPKG